MIKLFVSDIDGTLFDHTVGVPTENVDALLKLQEKDVKIEEFRNKFNEAINDDLNTSKALAVLFEMLKSNITSEDKYDLAISFDEVLGLLN